MSIREFKQYLAACTTKKEIFDPQYTTWGELSEQEELALRAERAGMTVQKAKEYLATQEFFSILRARPLLEKIQGVFDTALVVTLNPNH